ncbi:MAG TPA: flagellar hook-length control protein FliK [Noviherbaspirillum sp.]
MKTSAILNPVNITSGAASATKSSAAPADMPFSQVLSREMAPPPQTPEPAKASSAESSKSAQPARADDAKPDNAKSAEGSNANAAAEQQNSAAATAAQNKAADKAGAAEGGKPKEQTGDKGQEDDAPVLSAASAELLALVANLKQPAAEEKPVKGTDSAHDDKQAGVETVSQEAGMQLSDPAAAAQAAGQALLPSGAAQRRGQADTGLTSGATTSPARRGAAVGKGMSAQGAAKAAVQETGQHENKHIGSDAAGNTPEPKEFDAKLAQAKDAKTESGDNPIKAAADRSGLAEVQQTSGMATAKTGQDLQQPGAAMPNIGALPGLSQAQMQPAASATPANASNTLAPPVGGNGWDQALGQKIVWMVGNEQQSASLTLNPPDLGPLHVVLNVSNNEATASFTAAQPEVRHALETAMPKLREMLGEAGIQLGQANVNAGTPNSQQNAFEQPQPSSRHNTAAAGNENIDTPMRVVRSQTIVSGQGLVDTFA